MTALAGPRLSPLLLSFLVLAVLWPRASGLNASLVAASIATERFELPRRLARRSPSVLRQEAEKAEEEAGERPPLLRRRPPGAVPEAPAVLHDRRVAKSRSSAKKAAKGEKAGKAEGARLLPPPDLPEHLRSRQPGPPSDPPILQTVVERVDADSSRLSSVARELSQIQANIDTVSKEALAHVFNMESMKSFIAAHAASLEEGRHLQETVDKLHAQAASLHHRLEAEGTSAVQLPDDIAKQRKEREETEARIAKMQAELKKLHKLSKANGQLDADIEALHTRSAGAKSAIKSAEKEMKAAVRDMAQLQVMNSHLEDELVRQHQYAEQCHKAAAQLQDVFDKKHGDALRRAEAGWTDVAREPQEIEQNSADLRLRLQRAHAKTVLAQQQIAATQAEMSALEQRAQVELKQLREELGRLRALAEAADRDLEAKQETRRNLEKRILEVEAEIRAIEARFGEANSALLRLRANNTQLKAELQQAHEAVLAAQLNIVTFREQALRSNTTAESLREAADERAAHAQRLAQISLAQILAAKKQEDDEASKAERAAMEAESSRLLHCNAIWDRDHPEVLEQLRQCVLTRQDLQTISAQVAALSSVLQAARNTNNG